LDTSGKGEWKEEKKEKLTVEGREKWQKILLPESNDDFLH